MLAFGRQERAVRTLVAVLIAGTLAGGRWAVAGETWPSIRPGMSAAEEKIDKQLEEKTSFEFIETPLRDVVEYLKDLHGIEIQMDRKALDAGGIGTETPITANLKGLSLRAALTLLFREKDLAYVVRDEVLLITSRKEADANLGLRIYHVGELTEGAKSADPLADLLRAALNYPDKNLPPNPAVPNSPTLLVHGQLLIVRDTDARQRRLGEFLAALGEAMEEADLETLDDQLDEADKNKPR